ncbi:barstar family protein [Micromonospora sp. DR5-3]|uniref:barstar family protein n=1 Tax=unclassified Micromonospora TaxID=2617518 RepID=UPI0011DB86FC|nr:MULTISPECIES: barstar family protein [unclassified Micromonospora]MCW3816964.1 barstar family protein [Micromonospora sp. DR5-3]TYC23456.1 barstar family protein [Micromonospora sp. MP36]
MTAAHPPAWLAFDAGPDAGPAGPDVEPVGLNAEHARVVLAGADARTRAGLFDALATALPLPDYFGGNWDALADVLADRLDTGPLALVVRDAGELLVEEPPAQLATLLDVLGQVAVGGRAPLRVVLREHPDRLPALRHRIATALASTTTGPPPDPR